MRRNIEDTLKNLHDKNIYFAKDNSSIKTLIMGNSHAFDLYWALIDNDKF